MTFLKIKMILIFMTPRQKNGHADLHYQVKVHLRVLVLLPVILMEVFM